MFIIKRRVVKLKWTPEDLQKYVQAKEYIDTAIIPVLGFQMNDEKKLEKEAFQREVLSIYTNEIEKELSGRLLLTPPYNYVKSDDMTKELERLNNWIDHIKEQPFTSVFILTFDNQWKKIEKNLNAELLWFPSVQTGDIKSEESIRMIRNQVDQISELIRTFW